MIRLKAPAKINLSLEITGRRGDGYHLLQGITVFADIGDVLTMQQSTVGELEIKGPYSDQLAADCPPDKNLISKSIARFSETTGRAATLRVLLEKYLPPAAGIGGGSADAAATLLALNELENRKLSDEELRKTGLELGADVPVCISSTATWVSGIGDRVTPFQNFPSFGIVLVNPQKALSTPMVFKQTQNRSEPSEMPVGLDSQSAVLRYLGTHKNDLTEAAIELVPEVGRLLVHLSKTGTALHSAMSGSGATCFALYKDAADAGLAANDLQAALPGYWVAAGQTRDWDLQSRQNG